MKLGIIFLLIIMAGISSCNKCKIEKYLPECIEQKTNSFCDSRSCETAAVEQYLFLGETVFLFDPGDCGADQTAEVYNADCVLLGSIGGFSGNTKIKGEEFSEANFVRTVWKQKK